MTGTTTRPGAATARRFGVRSAGTWTLWPSSTPPPGARCSRRRREGCSRGWPGGRGRGTDARGWPGSGLAGLQGISGAPLLRRGRRQDGLGTGGKGRWKIDCAGTKRKSSWRTSRATATPCGAPARNRSKQGCASSTRRPRSSWHAPRTFRRPANKGPPPRSRVRRRRVDATRTDAGRGATDRAASPSLAVPTYQSTLSRGVIRSSAHERGPWQLGLTT